MGIKWLKIGRFRNVLYLRTIEFIHNLQIPKYAKYPQV